MRGTGEEVVQPGGDHNGGGDGDRDSGISSTQVRRDKYTPSRFPGRSLSSANLSMSSSYSHLSFSPSSSSLSSSGVEDPNELSSSSSCQALQTEELHKYKWSKQAEQEYKRSISENEDGVLPNSWEGHQSGLRYSHSTKPGASAGSYDKSFLRVHHPMGIKASAAPIYRTTPMLNIPRTGFSAPMEVCMEEPAGEDSSSDSTYGSQGTIIRHDRDVVILSEELDALSLSLTPIDDLPDWSNERNNNPHRKAFGRSEGRNSKRVRLRAPKVSVVSTLSKWKSDRNLFKSVSKSADIGGEGAKLRKEADTNKKNAYRVLYDKSGVWKVSARDDAEFAEIMDALKKLKCTLPDVRTNDWSTIILRLCKWIIARTWTNGTNLLYHTVSLKYPKYNGVDIFDTYEVDIVLPSLPVKAPVNEKFIKRLVKALKTIDKNTEDIPDDEAWSQPWVLFKAQLTTQIKTIVGQNSNPKKLGQDRTQAVSNTARVLASITSSCTDYLRYVEVKISLSKGDIFDVTYQKMLTEIRAVRHAMKSVEKVLLYARTSSELERNLHMLKGLLSIVDNPLQVDSDPRRFETLGAIGDILGKKVDMGCPYDSSAVRGAVFPGLPEVGPQIDESDYSSLMNFIDLVIGGHTTGFVPVPEAKAGSPAVTGEIPLLWGYSWDAGALGKDIYSLEGGGSVMPSTALFVNAIDGNALKLTKETLKCPEFKSLFYQLFRLSVSSASVNPVSFYLFSICRTLSDLYSMPCDAEIWSARSESGINSELNQIAAALATFAEGIRTGSVREEWVIESKLSSACMALQKKLEIERCGEQFWGIMDGLLDDVEALEMGILKMFVGEEELQKRFEKLRLQQET
ncbi:hypothetical protein M3P05_02750 [Sansalvadorimonas sp. 2012CJ34-2]|uniref:Uncharacterized protein n=1 Tax=Parendozoicomonas callyspongiae TaxID=2942213 RepID=A0ABT0PBW4_9GAMM|nr:hypothetical protein [Sansalvadorimonas sp. 2012CJ34-2]MCL6268869.1 hypothetical protein [Sansalvadorimonas sp. 2012CJ34-2]